MRRILSFMVVLLFIVCFTSGAMALSDSEYRSLMKNQAFANADRVLNAAWAEAKDVLYGSDFDNLKRNQQRWIKSGRDSEAKYFMQNQGLSKVEAYAKVTSVRANYIRNQVRQFASVYDILVNRMTQIARQISKSSKPTAQASNMKAWNNKNNLVVFEYSGKDSFLINFWTSQPSVVFNDNIKAGMSVRELNNIFKGDDENNFNVDYNGKIYSVIGGNKQWINFGIVNGYVSFIEFVQAGEVIPQKIQSMIDRYESY